MMLPKCVRLCPSVSGPRDWKVTLQVVRDRLSPWSHGCLPELWNAVTAESQELSFSKTTSNNSSSRKVHRAERALEDGEFRKAVQAISFRGLAPVPLFLERLTPSIMAPPLVCLTCARPILRKLSTAPHPLMLLKP
uniref:Uncharacterized protein n=1 Tax=Amphimedon queenslandica TaxID=400682 RepID=A0A1X7UWY2_AMPQE